MKTLEVYVDRFVQLFKKSEKMLKADVDKTISPALQMRFLSPLVYTA